MQTFIYCKVTLHVSGVTAPVIRSTKTVTATSGIGHNTGTATSFLRGLIRTSPDQTASGIGHNTGTATSFLRGLIRTSPDQTTVEGSSCTSIMTYTRGGGYSF